MSPLQGKRSFGLSYWQNLGRTKLRPETEGWWRQAETDLRASEWNLEGGFPYMATWCAQQAAEKALKALWLERLGELPPRTHDLRRLGRTLAAPETTLLDLDVLVQALDRARYPDATGLPPIDLIGHEDAVEHVAAAQRTLKWIDEQLQSHSTQP